MEYQGLFEKVLTGSTN